ncbi:MAG: AI-2E family transporter [Bacteroidetes bacterium]|nr:AI-2E family transporter [Bacteroidota bacterium]
MKIEFNDATISRYVKTVAIMVVIIGLKVFGDILYAGRSIILPLAFATLISFILSPSIDWFVKKRFPEWLAITIPFVATGIIFFFLGIIVKLNIETFVVEFPKYEARTTIILKEVLSVFDIQIENFKSSPKEWLDDPRVAQYLSEFSLSNLISGLLSSISNTVSNIFIVLLFLLFIIVGRNQLTAKLPIAFEIANAERIKRIFENIKKQIQAYIIAKTLISLVTAFLFIIVLYSFGIQFAIVWGILTFLLNYIPTVGSIIATLLPLSIAIIQYESYGPIIWLGTILFTIQTIIGNFIDPKYIGKSINLSPIVVLFALIFWGWLWGIAGMFLSVPIMVIIKIILENIPELRFISVLMSEQKS